MITAGGLEVVAYALLSCGHEVDLTEREFGTLITSDSRGSVMMCPKCDPKVADNREVVGFREAP